MARSRIQEFKRCSDCTYDHRNGDEPLRADPGRSAGIATGAARFASVAHASDVAHQRRLRDLGGRRDSGRRRGRSDQTQPGVGMRGRGRLHHQYRQRIPDYRPHAEDVPEKRQIMDQIWQVAYIFAALSIVGSIKWLSSPATARQGVMAGQVGMLFAVIGTLLRAEVVNYEWILICIFIGAAIGAPLAYLMPMTGVTQLTALSHAFGALAAALVGTAEYYRQTPTGFTMTALVVETVLGYLTCTASIMAFGKLQEIIPTRPITYKGQNFVNIALLIFAVSLGVWMIVEPTPSWVFPTFTGLSLLFGVLLIIPIGGGDMPTVIALLNSYAGAACAAMGFVLSNRLLIIAGALNAASGFILSVIMCKAMNRSFLNVLFGAFGQVQEGASAAMSTRSEEHTSELQSRQ